MLAVKLQVLIYDICSLTLLWFMYISAQLHDPDMHDSYTFFFKMQVIELITITFLTDSKAW